MSVPVSSFQIPRPSLCHEFCKSWVKRTRCIVVQNWPLSYRINQQIINSYYCSFCTHLLHLVFVHIQISCPYWFIVPNRCHYIYPNVKHLLPTSIEWSYAMFLCSQTSFNFSMNSCMYTLNSLPFTIVGQGMNTNGNTKDCLVVIYGGRLYPHANASHVLH